MSTKANKTMFQAFEWYLKPDFNHWNHLKNLVPEIKSYGIGMVWLPPAYKEFRSLLEKDSEGKPHITDNAIHATGYGVYDRYDLGEFKQVGETEKTKYGSKEEYLDCIHAFQNAPHHIDVIVDVVLNQMFNLKDVKEKEPVKSMKYIKDGDRSKPIGGPYTIQAPTIFKYPVRNGAYNTDTWNHTDFNSHSFDEEDWIFLFDKKEFNPRVDEGRDIHAGKNPYKNFDYLMGSNIDFTNSHTKEKLLNWMNWYLDITGADGIRIDAVKHMDYLFIPELMNSIIEHKRITNPEYDGEDFFAVGEYWCRDEQYGDLLGKYLNKIDDAITLFDVPLHEAFLHAFDEDINNRKRYDIRTLYKESLLNGHSKNAVTFVDNHDTQPGQMLKPNVNPEFRQHAYAIILFQGAGTPCVFYGDLYGIPYHDDEKNIRSIPPLPLLGEMCKVRKSCAHGKPKFYFLPDEDIQPFDISKARDKAEAESWTKALNEIIKENNRRKQYFGFTRPGIKDYKYSGMAVMISNGSGGTIRMHVNARYADEFFVNMLNTDYEAVKLNQDGDGDFFVKDNQAAVWIRQSAYEYIFDVTLEIMDRLDGDKKTGRGKITKIIKKS